jgi:hypothetical protein
MSTKAGRESIGLGLKINADQRADRKAKEGEKTRLLQDQLIEKKLAAQRSGGKPWKQDQATHDIVTNRLMLNEAYKDKGMNSKTKSVVADAISQKAFDLIQDPTNKVSSSEAYAMAEQQVMSRVDEDGKYTPEGVKSTKDSGKESSKFEEGKVYTDAKGNKAKYVKGQWVPQ